MLSRDGLNLESLLYFYLVLACFAVRSSTITDDKGELQSNATLLLRWLYSRYGTEKEEFTLGSRPQDKNCSTTFRVALSMRSWKGENITERIETMSNNSAAYKLLVPIPIFFNLSVSVDDCRLNQETPTRKGDCNSDESRWENNHDGMLLNSTSCTYSESEPKLYDTFEIMNAKLESSGIPLDVAIPPNNEEAGNFSSRLEMSMEIICEPNYFGRMCDKYCLADPSRFQCDSNGEKVFNKGPECYQNISTNSTPFENETQTATYNGSFICNFTGHPTNDSYIDKTVAHEESLLNISDILSQNHSIRFKAENHSTCENGGSWNSEIIRCFCPEGWFGKRCEFKLSSLMEYLKVSTTALSSLFIILLTGMMIIELGIFGIIIGWKCRRNKLRTRRLATNADVCDFEEKCIPSKDISANSTPPMASISEVSAASTSQTESRAVEVKLPVEEPYDEFIPLESTNLSDKDLEASTSANDQVTDSPC